MPPKKGNGNRKGKNPVKKQVVVQQPTELSSSDDESWALLQELHAKVANMEARRFERQVDRSKDITPRRSPRESKGKRKGELRALTSELMRRFDVLESEQGRKSPGCAGDRSTVAEATERVGRKHRRVEAVEEADPGEGTANEGCHYEDPYADMPREVEVAGNGRRGGEMRETRKKIMIVGHSYIFWAARYAANSHWGSDLGLGAQASISWKGRRGMRWIQLGRVTAFDSSPPDILLIHLGGNDLPQVPGKALILDILRDLARLHASYPLMRICWSTIVPRRVWRGALNVDRINYARRLVNREVCRGICTGGLGAVIGHHSIRPANLECFRNDGVHLSVTGLDKFLDDLRGGLLVELGVLGGHMGHSGC
uniref:SGNH hydrolase-type esterase domain-containing protein n=1 Tax=Pogona vitticeps TaxID=103695 RepID=A0ABM5GQZ0_9SAUR